MQTERRGAPFGSLDFDHKALSTAVVLRISLVALPSGEKMRGHLVLVVACAGLTACVPDDAAYTPVFLPPPYSDLPPALPGESIEAGKPVDLNARQQEAVVAGVIKWMKDPRSAHFGTMQGARNSRGRTVVCGQVDGRNSAGGYVGLSPFIGVLMGSATRPDFVVVGIGASSRERAEVTALCRDSGVALRA